MTPMERDEVVLAFTGKKPPYEVDTLLVHELFEKQAACSPLDVAVLHEGRSLTYDKLNRSANRLARHLRKMGVGPDHLVGVRLERSPEMVVALLGILKAGGAYLALDPRDPAERLRYMLEDANARVVLTQDDLPAGARTLAVEVIEIGRALRELAGVSGDNLALPEGITAHNAVCVIYTSDPSGRPKGAVISHAATANLLAWHRYYLNWGGDFPVLQLAPLSCEVAFQEIFSTLCSGGTLVLANEAVRRDSRALLELLVSQQIMVIFVPSPMLQSLAEHASGEAPGELQLKAVIATGEPLRTTPEIARLFEGLEDACLHHHYGPAETHVVAAQILSENPQDWPEVVPIGPPIGNVRVYILDEQQRPVPMGAAGEIYIAGAGVGRGYLNRPELTAQRFVPDPFSTEPQARMYKTGDVGRRHPNLSIELLGRKDEQVRIRDYRIEPGEIEVQLAQHPQVKEAVVLAREDAPGEKSLVAYVTRCEQGGPSVAGLRAHLRSVLPGHMVPRHFVLLDRWPLTPSGMLDRHALPAPEQDGYEPPQGEVEEMLAGLWLDLLGVEKVDRRDRFIELGGNSLLIAQLVQRLRQAGYAPEPQMLCEAPLTAVASTLAGQPTQEPLEPMAPLWAGPGTMWRAEDLEPADFEQIAQAVPGGAGNIQDIYFAVPDQEDMVFHHRLIGRDGDVYVLPILISLPSEESVKRLIDALRCAIDRHDVLRTLVVWEGLPSPVQVICHRAALEVEHLVLDEPLAGLKERSERLWVDMRQVPPMRLQLVRDVRGAGWQALLQVHLIACQRMFWENLLSEVMACVKDTGQSLAIPVEGQGHAPPSSEDELTKRGMVEEPVAPFVLVDRLAEGGETRKAHVVLDPALGARLSAKVHTTWGDRRREFHAAWELVVAQTSGRDEAIYGSLRLGRLQAGGKESRGLGMMLIDTFPLKVTLKHDRKLIALLRASGRPWLESPGSPPAKEHPERAAEPAPLFATRNYPILISATIKGDKVRLTAKTARHIDPQRVLEEMTMALQSVVEAVDRAPGEQEERWGRRLAHLPNQERALLIERFKQLLAKRDSPRARS